MIFGGFGNNEREEETMPAAMLFTNIRSCLLFILLIFSGVVLGFASHFASVFLPKIHHDFLIMALVAPSATILIIIIIVLRSTPFWDSLALFVMSVLWLAMGSWSADIIAHVQCDALAGQTTQTKNGTMSSQAYCVQMKVILAFSWTIYVILALALLFVISRVIRMISMGTQEVWGQPIAELPWFAQYSPLQHGSYWPNPAAQQGMGGMGMGMRGMGMAGQTPYMTAQTTTPYMAGQTMPSNTSVVKQAPGHSLVIGTPAVPGGAPIIQQVPTQENHRSRHSSRHR